MAANKRQPKIGYFLNSFPKLSETFILSEMLELQRKGVSINVFALREGKEKILQKGSEGLLRDAWFSTSTSRMQKLGCLFRVAMRHPLRLVRLIRFIRQKVGDEKLWALKETMYFGGAVINRKIDHIHAHFALEAAEKAMLVSLLTGTPYSFHAHAVDIFVYQKLLKEKMKYSKFISTACFYGKRFLNQFYPEYPDDRIHVIRVGIDMNTFWPAKKTDKNSSKEAFRISSAARLVEKKGFQYLINAAGILKKEGLKFKVTIVGDGPEEVDLHRLIRESKVEDEVRLVGPRNSDYIREVLNNSNLFVLPCITAGNGDVDATPTSILEAMAMEVPVVSTAVSGIPEIVPQRAGILVPEKDSERLAEAIKRIYEMGESERRSMGAAGREFIMAMCNVAVETEKLMQIIDSYGRKAANDA